MPSLRDLRRVNRFLPGELQQSLEGFGEEELLSRFLSRFPQPTQAEKDAHRKAISRHVSPTYTTPSGKRTFPVASRGYVWNEEKQEWIKYDQATRFKPPPYPFDAEGEGYDRQTAIDYDLKPDETGHWPSRNPKTGQLLKGAAHETMDLTIENEWDAGYDVVKKKGRYYSYPIEGLSEYVVEDIP